MTRSKAQRAADARYEKKRRSEARVTLRLSDKQEQWLSERQEPGESRPAAIRRLCGMPEGGEG